MTFIPTWSDCDLTLDILPSPPSVSGMENGQHTVLQAFVFLTATILAVIGICVFKGNNFLLLIGAYGKSDVSQGVTCLHVGICFHINQEMSSNFLGLSISFLAFTLIALVFHSIFVCSVHCSFANGVRSILVLLFISCMTFA